jgi:hypothetical protein
MASGSIPLIVTVGCDDSHIADVANIARKYGLAAARTFYNYKIRIKIYSTFFKSVDEVRNNSDDIQATIESESITFLMLGLYMIFDIIVFYI